MLWIGIRETREGWPLLTVETGANAWGLLKTNEGGPSLVGSLGSSCQYKRFLALSALDSTEQNIFFLTVYFFNFCVPDSPSPSNLGRQSYRAACLWMCFGVCLSDWNSLSQDLASARLFAKSWSRPRFLKTRILYSRGKKFEFFLLWRPRRNFQKKPSPKGNIHYMIFLLFWIPIQIHWPYWIRMYSNLESDPGSRPQDCVGICILTILTTAVAKIPLSPYKEDDQSDLCLAGSIAT